MDEAAKKQILRMIPYGLYVLGAGKGDELAMAAVNWVTQTSFQPPLLVMGVKVGSGAHDLMKREKTFALSMLKSGQKDAAYAFFKPSVALDGKMNGYAFSSAANGCPTLDDAAGYVAGQIHEVIERGDHAVFIGEVSEAVRHGKAEVLTLKEIGANYGG